MAKISVFSFKMVRDFGRSVNQTMQVSKAIFKTYDIRGLVGSEVTAQGAYHLGRAYATFLSEGRADSSLTIVVGHDMRLSSLELRDALTRGLMEGGAHVLDIGLVATPVFYFGVGHLRAQGGIMVTASHNPATYNGFKCVRETAIPVGGDSGFARLIELIETEAYRKGTGSLEEITGMTHQAVEAQKVFAGEDLVRPMKIVADPGNGMGATYLDELFSLLPLEVTRLYWDLDGSFPNHESNPLKEETLKDLQAKVLEQKADLGIATDGDGDRIFFVDDEGKTVEPAIIRGLLSRVMLRRFPGATICYDVRPGKITEDMIIESGGKPSRTPVGHSLIKAQMRHEGAVFGGESTGHFYYNFSTGTYDGPVTAIVQILQEMTREGTSLSQLITPLSRYTHSGEINARVEHKDAVLARLKERYADGKQDEQDGLTITYPTFWFNVRSSNTEPLLRLNLEAVDRKTMEEKRDEIVAMINS
jgi:phosphomannomutase